MKYKYDHLGMPVPKKQEGMIYLPEFKAWNTDYTKSEYGIVWIYFEKDSPLHPLIQTQPHICFIVPDIQQAVHGKKILLNPFIYENEWVTYIEDNGAVIEFIQHTPW